MESSIPPLLTDARRQEELARASRDWPSWTLTPRQLGDLELILTRAYAPLDRFMTRADADACSREMRLADGAPFPAPVLLDVSEACANAAMAARRLVLRDVEGVAIAVLEVLDSWQHGSHFVGGPVIGLQLPSARDVTPDPLTAAGVTEQIHQRGWSAAVAFPTRGLIHVADYNATRAAMDAANAGVIVLALVDPAEDDLNRYVRIRCLDAVVSRYAGRRALIWQVPLPVRETIESDFLLAAVIARNAGCTQVLNTDRLDAEAKNSVTSFARQLNLTVVHAPIDRAAEARLRAEGERLPDGYTFPEVEELLAVRYPPKHQRGFTVFFTGLSGSGKSTIANVLRVKLVARTGRPVTLLDGDVVRQHLSSELGFSREHRDLNIRRIAFVASEITRHGGIAICAPIAPYDNVRQDARHAIEVVGGFILVYVDTPLEVCEARDRKGLYAKARAGLIREFTGISDPYERPADADVVIRTSEESADDAADRVLEHLEQHGYLLPGGDQWAR